MAYEDLLDHKCAIYHMQKADKGLGYGITTGSFLYPEEPDVTEVPCHFNVGDSGSLNQTEDTNEYLVTGKLQLLAGTEVYVNDKIVDLGTGLTYTAEIPRNIRDHHVVVKVQRKGKVKGAL